MRKIVMFSVAVAMLAMVFSCNKTQTGVKLSNQTDTISWAMGESVALGFQQSGLDIDKDVFLKAIEATLNGGDQPLDNATYQQVLNYANGLILANQRENQQQAMEKAAQDEKTYFAKLEKENPNVIKSDKGFYYEVVTPSPNKNARTGKVGLIAVFDYKGYFTNGQLFDQTYGNRDAITHVIGNPMFQGLIDALCLMPEGSTYRFYFPNELAFGAQGDVNIPPYTAVIYEIALHEIHE